MLNNDIINLLAETVNVLHEHHKTLDDVKIFCGEDFQFSKEEFIKFADVDYDYSYKSDGIVAIDLKLYGDGFILVRNTYDGLEWWDYISIPDEKMPFEKISKLVGNGLFEEGRTLRELNGGH